MYDRVEVFMSNGGQDFQLDALELQFARADIMRPAVHGNVVAPGGQPGRKMFSEGFEPAIVGGNSPRAKNRDAHSQN